MLNIEWNATMQLNNVMELRVYKVMTFYRCVQSQPRSLFCAHEHLIGPHEPHDAIDIPFKCMQSNPSNTTPRLYNAFPIDQSF